MAQNQVISYPIPLYANVPIQAQFYKPSRFVISAITLGSTTLVTTTVDHNYVIGQLVRLIIPNANGTYQLNEKSGYVISIPTATQVVLDIDSSMYNLFQTSSNPTQPQILATGDINSGKINNNGNLQTGTYIPGSFQNISPL